jgi:hypothetical protein
VRATLWIAFAGSWAAGWWVFFSPLRRMRGLEDQQDPEAAGLLPDAYKLSPICRNFTLRHFRLWS